MTLNDTERIHAIIEGLNFVDHEALDVWIQQGAQLDYDGIYYTTGLRWSDDGYRVETEEDREADRERRRARQERLDNGTASNWEKLMDATMKRYFQLYEL